MGITASYYGNRRPDKGEKPLSSQVLTVDQMKDALPFGKKNPVDAMTGKHLFRLEKPEIVEPDLVPSVIIYLRSIEARNPAIGCPYVIGEIEGDVTSAKLMNGPVFSMGTLTDACPFVIALKSAKSAGQKIPAVASGVAPALVNVSDEAHMFADVLSGALVSAESGYARIIWKAGTSGEQWCLLALPATAGGSTLDDGTAAHQVLVWNNSTKVWESGTMTQVTYLTDWRLDKTNHKFQVKTRTAYVLEAGTESAWTDITDANGGTLDEGVIP
jgi:hypothetical protein